MSAGLQQQGHNIVDEIQFANTTNNQIIIEVDNNIVYESNHNKSQTEQKTNICHLNLDDTKISLLVYRYIITKYEPFPNDIIAVCLAFYKQLIVYFNWNPIFSLIEKSESKKLLFNALYKSLVNYSLFYPTKIQQDIISNMIYDNINISQNDETDPHDTQILAYNGCGKTLALCIATLLKIDPNVHKTQILFLVPTRALNIYITNIFKMITKYINNINVTRIIIDNVPNDDEEEYEFDVDLLCGTDINNTQIVIGGIRDIAAYSHSQHFMADILHYFSLELLILDESYYSIMDVKHKDLVYDIFQFVPTETVLIQCSGYVTDDFHNLSNRFMPKPKKIENFSKTHNVDQLYHNITCNVNDDIDTLKIKKIVSLIEDDKYINFNKNEKVLIFGANFAKIRDELISTLNMNIKLRIESFLEKQDNKHCDEILQEFIYGNIDILVCIDDISWGCYLLNGNYGDISLIINYNPTDNAMLYRQRMSRLFNHNDHYKTKNKTMVTLSPVLIG